MPVTANALVSLLASTLQGSDTKWLQSVLSLEHSFEGWAKFQFAAAIIKKYGYEPFVRRSDGGYEPGDVGVEYKAKLKRTSKRKQIDLWVSPKKRAHAWHFLELKVAFGTHFSGAVKNTNTGKQLCSWRDDFLLLQAMDRRGREQKVLSVSSVLVAVGFKDRAELSARIRADLGALPARPFITTVAGAPLFLAHLCKTY